MRHHDVPTACSCPLPAGHWSSSGFHHRCPSEEALYNRELWMRVRENRDLADLVRRWKAMPAGPARDKVNQELEIHRREARTFVQIYAGRPESYEPCPAAVEGRRRAILERKRDDRAGQDREDWIGS